MNYKIKNAIDDFCRKRDYENYDGNELPNTNTVKKSIDEVLCEQSKAGRKITLEQSIKYMEEKDLHGLFRVRKYCEKQLNEIMEKLAISDNDYINEDMERFKEQQRKEKIKYTDDYMKTAAEMWEPNVVTKKEVWKHMEDKRSEMGLPQEYTKSTLSKKLQNYHK